MFFPSDKSYKYFSSFVFENDESTIKEVTSMIKDRMRAFRNQFSGQQGLLQVTPIHSGGKAGSPAANATAFPGGRTYVISHILWCGGEKNGWGRR